MSIAPAGTKRYKANDGSILFNPIEREVRDIIEKMDKEEDEQMEADKDEEESSNQLEFDDGQGSWIESLASNFI